MSSQVKKSLIHRCGSILAEFVLDKTQKRLRKNLLNAIDQTKRVVQEIVQDQRARRVETHYKASRHDLFGYVLPDGTVLNDMMNIIHAKGEYIQQTIKMQAPPTIR